jgi:hypothetical protein
MARPDTSNMFNECLNIVGPTTDDKSAGRAFLIAFRLLQADEEIALDSFRQVPASHESSTTPPWQ